MEKIKKFFADESGNATEYGLIIALVSVAIIFGGAALGSSLNTLFNDVAGKLGLVAPA